jgi:AraC-like DNA-binding protein
MSNEHDQVIEADVLWRISGHGQESYKPGSGYWWANRDRTPVGGVVWQQTLGGQLLLRTPAGDHFVPPGSAALFAYGEPTEYGLAPDATQAYQCRWIALRGAGLWEHWSVLRRRYGPVIRVQGQVQLHTAVDHALGHFGRAGSPDPMDMAAAVQQFVIHLFAAARQQIMADRPPVQLAIDDLLRNPTYGWSLKQLAADYQVSREHLARTFTQRTGQTPAAYLREARLNAAIDLLTNTNLGIEAVAEQCGLGSGHTLARLVRRRTGKSPGELRRQERRVESRSPWHQPGH